MVVTYGPGDSRCMYTVNAPQQVHWAVVNGSSRTVVRELIGAVRAHVPAQAHVDAIADVQAVIERFEQCRAVHPQDVKQIVSQSDLWEMRVEIETYALLLRIYETEIPQLPGNIVALRAHRKVIFPGDDARIAAHQDANIRIATSRWHAGRSTYWGL